MTEKIGLSPGSAIYTGKVESKEPSLRIISYDADTINIDEDVSIDELQDKLATHKRKLSD